MYTPLDGQESECREASTVWRKASARESASRYAEGESDVAPLFSSYTLKINPRFSLAPVSLVSGGLRTRLNLFQRANYEVVARCRFGR